MGQQLNMRRSMDAEFKPNPANIAVMRKTVDDGHPQTVQLMGTVPGLLIHTVDDYLQQNEISSVQELALMTGCRSNSLHDLLVWGAAIGSINLVKYLIAQGADPTFADNSAIRKANEYGQSDGVVNYLLTLPGVHL